MHKAMERTTEVLPDDLVEQIQLRLAVKSLLRFKCVSKKWCSTISDPQFCKSHFKFSQRQQQTLAPKFLTSTSLGQFQSVSFGDKSLVRELTFPVPFRSHRRPQFEFTLLGSCNGMVCVGVETEVYRQSKSNPGNCRSIVELHLWNPSTGYIRNLPCPSFENSKLVELVGFGFGYVSATDDYKVVLKKITYEIEARPTFEFEIFSFRAKSWKEKEPPFREHDHLRLKGPYLNEALHWIDYCDRPCLHIFDLTMEEFRRVALPNGPIADSSYIWDNALGVVSGCLAVTRIIHCSEIQLWVMREYNVPESWTLVTKCHIGYEPQPRWISRPVFCYGSNIIIKYLNVNEKCSYQLIRFDHQEEKVVGKVTVHRGRHEVGSRFFNVIAYDESLLQIDDY